MASVGDHINEMFEKLPNWIAYLLLALLWVGIPLLAAYILSLLFWKLYWFFIFLFIFIPILSYIFKRKFRSSPIPIHQAKTLKKTVLAITGIVVLTFVINFQSIRDYLSNKIIPGYKVEYFDGESSNISTDHWYFTVLSYLILPIFFALLIIMITFVYRQLEKIKEDSEAYYNK